MEELIEEKIKEHYQNVKIEVFYVDLRQYKVKLTTEVKHLELTSEFTYTYDAKLTFDYNIVIIEHNIDNMLISIFKKGE